MCPPSYKYLDDTKVLGPDLPRAVNCDPLNGKNTLPAIAFVGQRKSDGKYQLLLTNTSTGRTNIGYYIVYNGSDPTATTFSTTAEVNDYLNTTYVSSPPSKLFDSHNNNEDVTAIYAPLVQATFYDSSYSTSK